MKKVLSFIFTTVVVLLFGFLFSFIMLPKETIKKFNPHETIMGSYDLPAGFNSIFAGSGECALCHGDPNNGGNNQANRDALGNDISPATMWKGTMMANSAKDPFWRAKVSHEGLVNPSIKDDIENVCTKCHAPTGHFAAIHDGDDKYTISDMISDPLAMDGVSCNGCHSMSDKGLGSQFSANITYDTSHNVYGPFANPFQEPMQNMIGFTPNKGNHITKSEQCGICHTLITNPVDSNSLPLGSIFVEQAIYHEWLNSQFSQNDESCQSCHMSRIDEGIIISNRPTWLSDHRSPFGKHELVGGNTFMLKLFQKYTDSLQIAADSLVLQDVIERTRNMLKNRTLDLALEEINITSDTAFYELKIQNKAGHKFPSGYPARRAIVEFLAIIDAGDTIFHSGKLDDEYRVVNENTVYEPHHNTITTDSRSQIYEMVMGDVYGNTTTVLEYSTTHLKDNRLTPKGFTLGHSAYDTVEIAGAALNDINFNHESGVEGSGSDKINYHIALNGYSGDLKVVARVLYQSVPPKWLDEMFAHSSTEIDRFKMMYNSMDAVPEVVAEAANFDLTGVSEFREIKMSIYPNPTSGFVSIKSESKINQILIYNSNGRRVKTIKAGSINVDLDLPKADGVYLLVIEHENEKIIIERVVKY